MGVVKEKFGTARNGKEVYAFTISNANGMQAKIINFGAILVSLLVPDKDGKPEDVVLGYDSLEEYYGNGSFFGATIGPSANRIGGASFEINGKAYQIDVNDGPNNLHSHMENGYHKQVWDAVEGDNSVTLTLEGKDGEMGFPGNKKITMVYSLSEDNALKLSYHVSADADTIVNLTNHTYFNLAGHKAGKIEDHLLQLHAGNYTPVVPGAIPTGEIQPVAGTPMDFTKMKPIGQDINADFEQLKLTLGYDHNFVIDGADGSLKEIAVAEDPKSGRKMKVFTTLPGVQFYAGNCIGEDTGKDNTPYGPRKGFCLETQYYPDNIHHPNFPQSVFGPGRDYESVTVYQFL
ncbi:MAG: aldose epimerase family protein [Lachnospiraceae bacterium]|nr:galactose mutarotase [Lachnospiraceae bacterium]